MIDSKKPILLDFLYPETTNPNVLYQLEDNLVKVAKIICEWNIRNIDDGKAMYEVSKLLNDYFLREWNTNYVNRDVLE